ncbi:MAG: sulfurtransferase [Gammaproteobacteria bacterium]
MFETIIDRHRLKEHLGAAGWVIVDCRFDLINKQAGRIAYRASHIPGAVYADLEQDLSGPPLVGHGRHPLPSPQALVTLFGRLGIEDGTQVVAYDAAGGSIAARLWWLLRYMGHDKVAVLDRGWQHWNVADFPVAAGEQSNTAARFHGAPERHLVHTIDELASASLLLDSRDPGRYCGEYEPIDRVAGHIPGAINRCWKDNLDAEGLFLSADELHMQFAMLFKDISPQRVSVYCGSGVTACHNLLAIKHAGLEMGRLYAGSWSEWCADPSRPVAGHSE